MNSLQLFNQYVSSAEQLVEAFGDVVTFDPNVDGFGGGYGYSRLVRPATTIYDRSDGKYIPIFQNEYDLAVIRAMSRTLAEWSPGLVGGLRNLANYTFGQGFKFTASKDPFCGVDDAGAANVLDIVNREIAYLLDDNDFASSFDREIYHQSIVDGEAVLHLKPKADGRVRIYRREPDELRQPLGTRDLYDWIESAFGIGCVSEFVPSFSFAILTRLDQPDEPLGYHFVGDESGVNWDFADASRVVHIKRNVPRNAKRGFSDLYPIEGDALRGFKLLRNMTEGATARSSIVLIRELPAGVNRTGADVLVGDTRTGTTQQSLSNGGSRTQSTERFDRVKTYTVANGMQYKPPPSAEETADFLELLKEVQRQQAVRWSMPEYMFTGDASNANYSSTLVAESPFVKSCEAEQRVYSKHFVDMIWKALKIRWEVGAFGDMRWEDIERIVKIVAECPAVATRDALKAIQVLAAEVALGITSLDTAATEQGRVLADEQAKGARPQGGEVSQVQTDTGTPADANAAAVADTAFNGSQVTSLIDVVSGVASGTMPAASAIQTLLIAFPSITDAQARSVIDPAAKMGANMGTVPTATGGGELLGKNIQQVRRIDKLRQAYIDAFRAGEADRTSTELALDGLGYSKDKIALYLDGNPANDPIDEPLPESANLVTALKIIEELETYP